MPHGVLEVIWRQMLIAQGDSRIAVTEDLHDRALGYTGHGQRAGGIVPEIVKGQITESFPLH
jgi:hypothetical protein